LCSKNGKLGNDVQFVTRIVRRQKVQAISKNLSPFYQPLRENQDWPSIRFLLTT